MEANVLCILECYLSDFLLITLYAFYNFNLATVYLNSFYLHFAGKKPLIKEIPRKSPKADLSI